MKIKTYVFLSLLLYSNLVGFQKTRYSIIDFNVFFFSGITSWVMIRSLKSRFFTEVKRN